MAARNPSRTRSATLTPTMQGGSAGRSAVGYRLLEVTTSIMASAIIATMVAIGGTAVQVTSATPLPISTTAPRFFVDPNYTPEGEKTPRTVTPTPDPMVWCRPLSGSTICIREKT
jgi:hypothetical protein